MNVFSSFSQITPAPQIRQYNLKHILLWFVDFLISCPISVIPHSPTNWWDLCFQNHVIASFCHCTLYHLYNQSFVFWHRTLLFISHEDLIPQITCVWTLNKQTIQVLHFGDHTPHKCYPAPDKICSAFLLSQQLPTSTSHMKKHVVAGIPLFHMILYGNIFILTIELIICTSFGCWKILSRYKKDFENKNYESSHNLKGQPLLFQWKVSWTSIFTSLWI